MSEQVVIKISPNGEISIEGHGFIGPSCAPVIDRLSAALGVGQEEELKPEFEMEVREAPNQETVAEGGW